ncbi:ABC transporter ATP-binding protein [Spirulina major]|uniref:ABC transporter ATP-binding protein n=1 Tax=Spirulina major TaxID=270636 RepID=UPI0009322D4A|nr:ABC transporter ATP-binding protein [Spirulina major]
MNHPVLDVRHLCVQFVTDGTIRPAVDDISFTLARGQTLGIVGESGSGKSVTSLAILGLVPRPGRVSQGDVWFCEADGEPVNLLRLPEEERRRYRGGAVAMIFQDPMSSLNPVYTIGFQITEAIRLHQGVGDAEARRRAIASLQEVRLVAADDDLMTQAAEQLGTEAGDRACSQWVNQQKRAMLDRYPHELSGGQQQRVMIAMAIACNPTLLIADEPTTALDVTVQASILKLLADLCRSRQMSLVFITHDLGVIAEVADQVAVMYQGKIVERDRVGAIFQTPQHPYTQGLLACRPRLDVIQTYLPTVADFLAGNGQAATPEPPATPTPPADRTLEKPLLQVKNLRVGFPIKNSLGLEKRHFLAVNDVSFEVYPGETLGLVGESGCGKSTLAYTLLRLMPELAGEIYFEGENITQYTPRQLQKLRRKMQIVFQNPYNSLNPRMTVGNAIMEPLRVHNPNQPKAEQRDRAVDLLERVGLDATMMNRFPHAFSGGQRQRVCIARALALNPRFIICDESVSALDVSVQAQVLNLLKDLQKDFGLTYIFISHDLSVVKFMSDRIMVMNKGKIEEIDRAEAIYSNPKTDYTRQLIAAIPAGL